MKILSSYLKRFSTLQSFNRNVINQVNTDKPTYTAKFLIKYNNLQFKPEVNETNISAKEFLNSFTSSVINKSKELSASNMNASSCDYQLFDRETMKYLDQNDNIFSFSRIDITKVAFDKESLKQKYIDPDITNIYSPKFQNRLNSFLSKDLLVKTPILVENVLSRNKRISNNSSFINKMLLASYINSNSEKLDCKEVELLMSSHNISDFKALCVKLKNDNIDSISSDNYLSLIPISYGSYGGNNGFLNILFENFTHLKKLNIYSNRKSQIGVVTDLNKWYFLLYIKGEDNKVEKIDNFMISDPYTFSLERTDVEGNKLFTYFMKVLEGLSESKIEISDMI